MDEFLIIKIEFNVHGSQSVVASRVQQRGFFLFFFFSNFVIIENLANSLARAVAVSDGFQNPRPHPDGRDGTGRGWMKKSQNVRV